MVTDKMAPRQVFYKPFTVKFPDRTEWERGSIPVKKGELISCRELSKSDEFTEAGGIRPWYGTRV
jgi:hypothetical protein